MENKPLTDAQLIEFLQKENPKARYKRRFLAIIVDILAVIMVLFYWYYRNSDFITNNDSRMMSPAGLMIGILIAVLSLNWVAFTKSQFEHLLEGVLEKRKKEHS